MLQQGTAKKVTIFVNEDTQHHLSSLCDAILTFLLHKGVAGATATRAMAIELARWRVRVNAINPVAGDTPLLATFMGGEDTPAARERILTTIPLRRLSTPADIAAAAVFLCSDEAAMITGVALEVDGGRCL